MTVMATGCHSGTTVGATAIRKFAAVGCGNVRFREGLAAMLSKADVGSGPPDGRR